MAVRAGTLAVIGAIAVTSSVASGAAPTADAAGQLSVSGRVYWDRDDDGVRDAGEPGVGGVVVHWAGGNGTPTTATGPDGTYTLGGLTSGRSGKLTLETGWFRSQCSTLKCAAGPGPDNDYAVANQFVQYQVTGLTANRTGVDVGLLPDWPGSSATAPAAVAGVVASNPVDVASRLSLAASSCPDGSYEVCRVGDTYTISAQILNQGTTPVSGITAVLAVPDGDRFATDSPTRDLTLNRAATAPGITSMTVGPLSPTGTVAVSFAGVLVAGGELRVTGKLVVAGGTGTPGCVVGAVTSACSKAEPAGAPLVFAVTHIDQTGDPDSFGPNCDAAADVRACATGIHDKQVEPDEVDPVGHNVAASIGGSQAFDLSADVAVLTPKPAGGWRAGDSVTWRMSAANTGPGLHVPGWTLTLVLPKSSNPAVPASNAMRSCASSTSSAGFPLIRCTGKGPLSPAVTSVAMDVTMKVPTGTAAGASVPVLAYVAPAPGQAVEVVPLGTAPTQPSTNASSTSTNNDASAAVTTG
jgi:hypothetical protein